MTNNEKTTQVPAEAWQEWHRICTIGGCCQATVAALAKFGQHRLQSGLQRIAESLVLEYCDPKDTTRAWLQLEQHLYAGRKKGTETQTGKSYKAQLLQNVDSPTQMEGYLTRILQRDVARKIAQTEAPGGLRKVDGTPYKNISVVSLDAPLNKVGHDDDNTSTLLDLLSDDAPVGSELIEPTTAEADERLLGMAKVLATKIWEGWRERERLVFLLLLQGLTMAAILHSGLAGACKKTQLYESHKRLLNDIEQAEWGCEPGSRQHVYLTRLLLKALSAKAHVWLERAENRDAILSIIDDEQSQTNGSYNE